MIWENPNNEPQGSKLTTQLNENNLAPQNPSYLQMQNTQTPESLSNPWQYSNRLTITNQPGMFDKVERQDFYYIRHSENERNVLWKVPMLVRQAIFKLWSASWYCASSNAISGRNVRSLNSYSGSIEHETWSAPTMMNFIASLICGNWPCMTILNSHLSHGNLHYPTKFKTGVSTS